MPYSNVEDAANDGPGPWNSVAAPRFWFALKYRFAENIFMNIQNTSDDGLVLNVYEHVKENNADVKKQHTIILGKETGEDMVLEFEWSEADADGKYPLNVYVDGALVGSVENAMNIDSGLGKALGVLQFNAQWTKTDSTLETVDITFGNISVNEISPLYDEVAYNALINSQAGDNGDSDNGSNTTPDGDGDSNTTPDGDDGNTTPGGDDGNTTPSGDDNVSTGDDSSSDGDDSASEDGDDSSSDEEEEKKGCGSSIAGIGLVAVLGSALTAVVASKKKED